MNIFFIILVCAIVTSLLMIIYFCIYNNYQNLIVRINEVEVNIDSTLRKRFDLLNKSISIIKANADIKEDVLEIIVKLRSRKLSNFDLDRQLYDAINEFNNYRENYKELKENNSLTKIELELNETEHEIIAFRRYYNDTITEYNKLIKNFPTNIVGKISKYKERVYFDGKDMADDDIKDFKL